MPSKAAGMLAQADQAQGGHPEYPGQARPSHGGLGKKLLGDQVTKSNHCKSPMTNFFCSQKKAVLLYS